MDKKRDTDMYPNFQELVCFIEREAEEVTDPVYGQHALQQDKSVKATKQTKSTSSFATKVNDIPPKPKQKCVICGCDHKLFLCDEFKKIKPFQRLEIVNQIQIM